MEKDSFDAYYDEKARGVLFQVMVRSRPWQGCISCALLTRPGNAAAKPEDWVALYRSHQTLIDAAVAQRAEDRSWETGIPGR